MLPFGGQGQGRESVNGRSDDVALADGRALIMEEANLNAVQRGCLAVLRHAALAKESQKEAEDAH